MDKSVHESLAEKYGDRATTSELDRRLYSRDLAPVPESLVKPFFRARPEIIVRPSSSAEVADLVRRAAAAGMPITPRASGTTVFFNSVPVKGGMVVDLGLLNTAMEVDRQKMTVTVGAAVTWQALENHLNSLGFACKSMPSSAPSATVGGWFMMMGYGIGSLKYGSLLSQVRSAEAVLPSGEITTLTPTGSPPLAWYAASEGTLGIITALELEIRHRTPLRHHLFHCPGTDAAVTAMERLIDAESTPYTIHFGDSALLAEMDKLGYGGPPPAEGLLVAVTYEGEPAELQKAAEKMAQLAAADGSLSRQSEEEAEEEWAQRFRALRLKRGGPALLGGELLLPLSGLGGYLADIAAAARRHGTGMMSYGHVVSPSQATVMTMFAADERNRLSYVLDLGLVKKIQDIGHRHGGKPYGVGLWNTPYLGRLHDPSALKTLRRRKASLDPGNIMNPGKLYRAPAILNPLSFHLGMETALLLRRLLRKRG